MQQLNILRGKKVGVLGLARTGISTYLALKNSKIDVIAWDDNQETRAAFIKKASYYLSTISIMEDLTPPSDIRWENLNELIISPGIPTHYPNPHYLAIIAKYKQIKITSDIELLYQANPYTKYVGITGTNGKSTTTSLLGHILSLGKIQNEIGGNIGNAVMNLPKLRADGVYSLEVSSFQLELLTEFKANIAVLLNITPDHLDRYEDMQSYINTKIKIFQNQKQNDVAIINIDDVICNSIYHKLKEQKKHSKIIPFSAKQKLKYGAYISENNLYYNVDPLNIKIELPLNNSLLGIHNQQNILAAFSAAINLEVPMNRIIEALSTFQGLKHRMEYLGKINEVIYINDSKATNIDSCIPALSSFDNILWIAGGYIKIEENLEKLLPFLPRIKKAYLIGESSKILAKFLDNKVEFEICKTLENSFSKASKEAIPNDVILLSPCYASLDQFKDYNHRGDVFRTLFNNASTS